MDLLEAPRNRLSEFESVSVRRFERPTVHAAVLFAILTVLLTFPILLRPDRIYLTAPVGEFLFEGTDHFYVSRGGFREAADHVQHMDTLEIAANRWQSGESPLVVNPTFIVPPAYLLTGALVVSLLPVETVVFHNGFFLLSMFLAGFFTFLLVQKITDDPNVALLAGALYMSSFFLFNEYLLGHMNQWQIQWIPLILYGVERVRDPTDGRNVVLLGVAFLLQVMSSTQYSAYISFVLPLYIGLRYLDGAREFRSRRFWVRFVAAGLLALLLVTPYLWKRLSLTGETPTYSLAKNAYEGYVLNDTVGVFFVRDILPQLGFRLVLLLGGIVALVTAAHPRAAVAEKYDLAAVVPAPPELWVVGAGLTGSRSASSCCSSSPAGSRWSRSCCSRRRCSACRTTRSSLT